MASAPGIFTTPAVIAAARLVMRKLQQRFRMRGFNTRRYAICGVNELGIQLAKNIEAAPEMGLRLTGFFDDRPKERTAASKGSGVFESRCTHGRGRRERVENANRATTPDPVTPLLEIVRLKA